MIRRILTALTAPITDRLDHVLEQLGDLDAAVADIDGDAWTELVAVQVALGRHYTEGRLLPQSVAALVAKLAAERDTATEAAKAHRRELDILHPHIARLLKIDNSCDVGAAVDRAEQNRKTRFAHARELVDVRTALKPWTDGHQNHDNAGTVVSELVADWTGQEAMLESRLERNRELVADRDRLKAELDLLRDRVGAANGLSTMLERVNAQRDHLDAALTDARAALDATRANLDKIVAERTKLEMQLAAERDCGQEGVFCATAPGCARHWEIRNRQLVEERDALASAYSNVSRNLTAAMERVNSQRAEVLAEYLRTEDMDTKVAKLEADLSACAAECNRLSHRLQSERNCGQDDVCATAPGCARHWQERSRELAADRDRLAAKLAASDYTPEARALVRIMSAHGYRCEPGIGWGRLGKRAVPTQEAIEGIEAELRDASTEAERLAAQLEEREDDHLTLLAIREKLTDYVVEHRLGGQKLQVVVDHVLADARSVADSEYKGGLRSDEFNRMNAALFGAGIKGGPGGWRWHSDPAGTTFGTLAAFCRLMLERLDIGDAPEEERAPTLPLDREHLGRIVREVWIAWAKEQPNPKPSWLVPWEGLSEPDKEVDRRIGKRLAMEGVVVIEGQLERAETQIDILRRQRDAIGVGNEALHKLADCAKAQSARLDPDGTAKPLTRIVSHTESVEYVGPGTPLANPEHVAADGTRTPLAAIATPKSAEDVVREAVADVNKSAELRAAGWRYKPHHGWAFGSYAVGYVANTDDAHAMMLTDRAKATAPTTPRDTLADPQPGDLYIDGDGDAWLYTRTPILCARMVLPSGLRPATPEEAAKIRKDNGL